MSEILKLAYTYKIKYGKSFDIKAFLDAARQSRASSLNPNDFMRNKQDKSDKKSSKPKKNKKKPPKLKQNGGGFSMDFSNGKCIARGFGCHKGTELSAENAYQLFMLMNQQMNAKWESEKTPPEDRIGILSVSPYDKNKDKIMKDCFKAAIESNIIMAGDLPKDKEFYAQIKKEFFKNPKNAEKDWNRLTRFVPPAYLPIEKNQDKDKDNKSSSQENKKLTPVQDQDKNKNNKRSPLSPSALAAIQARAGGR